MCSVTPLDKTFSFQLTDFILGAQVGSWHVMMSLEPYTLSWSVSDSAWAMALHFMSYRVLDHRTF